MQFGINKINEGSWALDPFGPGERVTLGRGLVNQQVAPLFPNLP